MPVVRPINGSVFMLVRMLVNFSIDYGRFNINLVHDHRENLSLWWHDNLTDGKSFWRNNKALAKSLKEI